MYHRAQIKDSIFIQVFNLPLEVAYYSSNVDDRNYFHVLRAGTNSRRCWVGRYVKKIKSDVSHVELYEHCVLSIEVNAQINCKLGDM